jgi:hypothetical protein
MRGLALVRRAVVVAATGLALAVPSASALSLEVGGHSLAVGSPVTAFSTNFKLKAAAWQFVCEETTFTGKLVSPTAVSIEEAAFVGGDPMHEELCKSPSDLVPTWNPQTPPKFEFGAKGKAFLLNARVRLVPLKYVEAPEGHHHGCNPEKVKTKGSYKATETPKPLVANFGPIKWKGLRESGNESACKENPVFSAGFSFSSEGQTVEVVS